MTGKTRDERHAVPTIAGASALGGIRIVMVQNPDLRAQIEAELVGQFQMPSRTYCGGPLEDVEVVDRRGGNENRAGHHPGFSLGPEHEVELRIASLNSIEPAGRESQIEMPGLGCRTCGVYRPRFNWAGNDGTTCDRRTTCVDWWLFCRELSDKSHCFVYNFQMGLLEVAGAAADSPKLVRFVGNRLRGHRTRYDEFCLLEGKHEAYCGRDAARDDGEPGLYESNGKPLFQGYDLPFTVIRVVDGT